jgi:hypothetical protein
MFDPVNYPRHYTENPTGLQAWDITQHMNFCLGNAVKYIWRVSFGGKANDREDLEKAIKYLEKEIKRRYDTPPTR